MKTLLTICASLAFSLVAGCGSKGGDPAQCSAAAEKGVATMVTAVKARAESTGATPEQVTQITDGIGKLKDVLVKHCTEDKWPKAVIDCYGAASSQPEFKACREKLPKEAADKLRADEMQVMSSMMGAMGGMRGHGMRMGAGSGMGGGSGDMATPPPAGSGAAMPAPSGSAAAPAPAGSAH
ncbi:MAG TPA: hypothetical protein VH143_14500 [Kofleriaceae bacterium]|jgi:hypothetical protein|nr:hypothetical protein [Kofleriaceae bacterium]